VAVAGGLVLIKMGAWLVTDSVALLSSMVDSMLDAVASVINLFAVRTALAPPDEDHRFGHGKAEPLAGLAQAAFVAGSSVLLVSEAVSRLFDPAPIARGEVGIAVMLVSIAATVGLVAYQRHVIRRTRSVAISADSLHYAGDVLMNAAVIVSLVLAGWLGVTWADPLFALGIAAYLLRNAWVIFRESLDLLMDREFEADDRERILEIARDDPHVHDVHDLRTRSSGQRQFVQLHLELDRHLSLLKAHAIADRVEGRIRAAFPAAEVMIHQDPADVREPGHDGLVYADREKGVPETPIGAAAGGETGKGEER